MTSSSVWRNVMDDMLCLAAARTEANRSILPHKLLESSFTIFVDSGYLCPCMGLGQTIRCRILEPLTISRKWMTWLGFVGMFQVVHTSTTRTDHWPLVRPVCTEALTYKCNHLCDTVIQNEPGICPIYTASLCHLFFIADDWLVSRSYTLSGIGDAYVFFLNC